MMSKLPIFALASALVPAAALAQTVSPPVAWEDTPQVRLNVPGGAVAAAAQAPAALPAPRPMPVAAPAPMPPRPMPAPAAAPPHFDRPATPHPHMRPGQQIDRRWWGPRVAVRNYGLYGLYPPAAGSRWVRYYDDALLVDGDGMVSDGRYDLDWDRGEQWTAEDGIPVYVGNGDYRPDRDDYAYVEDYDRGPAPEAYADREDYREAAPPMPRYEHREVRTYYRDGPPPIPAGYITEPYQPGRFYPPGAVITETTVTTPPVVTTRIYYVEKARGLRPGTLGKRLVRSRRECDCRPPVAPVPAPLPRPIPYGEKG